MSLPENPEAEDAASSPVEPESEPTDQFGQPLRADEEAQPSEAPEVVEAEVVETAEQVEAQAAPGSAGAAAEGEAVDAEPVWTPEPDKLIMAILFASQDYLGVRALKEILGEDIDAGRIRKQVKLINQQWRETNMPFEVVEVDATFRVRTLPKYFPWVRKLFKEANPRRLSQASLETLAIIAYKQPITKAEIEAIRGVNVDGCMKSLMEKKLVDVNGRSDSVGSAFTYSTTREFMRYFGISRVPDDLPRLSEFEAIVNAQALIPQVGADGQVIEAMQPEPDGEQLSLDQMQ